MALTKISTAMISQSAAAVDLNVDAGTFYVDTTNNRVGVGGKTDPDTPLHVVGTATATLFAGSGASLTSIPNSALVNSSITINSTAVSLGGSITLGTDDLSEGSSNLYYTDARVDARVSGGSLGNITTTGYIRGPATFTLDPAAHGDDTGTVVIAGNLQVDGTTTTINSTTLTVDDKNITLASGSANAAAADGAGFTVDIGTGTNPAITYDGTNDEWDFNKNINVDTVLTATGIVHDGDTDTSVKFLANRLYMDVGGNRVFDAQAGDVKINGPDGAAGIAIDTGGNVGIGTDAPASNLHIKTSVDNSVAQGLVIERSANSDKGYINYNGGGFQFRSTVGDPIVFGETDAEHMRILPDGNVGIGTTAPYYKLDTRFSNATTALSDGSSGNWGSNGIRIDNTDTTVGAMALAHFRVGDADWHIGNKRVGTNQADFIFANEGVTKMLIDHTGNVGIGTDAPAAKLNVYTDAGRDFRVDHGTANRTILSTDRGMIIKAGGGYSLELDTGSDTGLILFKDNGVTHSQFNASGNLALGTTTHFATGGAAKLSVAGILSIGASNADMSYIRRQSTGNYAWQTYDNNNTGSIQLQPYGGNVGIGTDSPSRNLTVKVGSSFEGIELIDAAESLFLIQKSGSSTNTSYVSMLSEGNTTVRLHADNVSYFNGGNVGIGTASPSETLELTRLGKIGFGMNGNYGVRIGYFDDGGGTHGFHVDTKHVGTTTSETRFVVRADSGNVGIGTKTPAAPLHTQFTNNDGAVGGHLIKNINTGTTSNFASLSTQAVNGTIQGTFGSAHYSTWGGAATFAGSQTNHPFKILTSNVVRATFDTAGNVGIGTTPQSFSKLQVKATTDQHVSIFTNSSGLTIGGLTDNGGSGALRIAGAPLHLTGQGGGAGSGPDIAIISGGNVGIGTTSPYSKLWVSGPGINAGSELTTDDANSNALLTLAGNNALVRLQMGTMDVSPYGAWIQGSYDNSGGADGVEPLILNPIGGNVGIGVINPGQTLEIHNSDASDYTDFALRGTGHKYVIGVGNDSVATVNDKWYLYDNDNTAFRMVVDTSGKVGIGTTSLQRHI